VKKLLLIIALIVVAVLSLGILADLFFAGVRLMSFAVHYLLLPLILVAVGIYLWHKVTRRMS
jgi:hypothetical protein